MMRVRDFSYGLPIHWPDRFPADQVASSRANGVGDTQQLRIGSPPADNEGHKATRPTENGNVPSYKANQRNPNCAQVQETAILAQRQAPLPFLMDEML
jgi:hypothetical protein